MFSVLHGEREREREREKEREHKEATEKWKTNTEIKAVRD